MEAVAHFATRPLHFYKGYRTLLTVPGHKTIWTAVLKDQITLTFRLQQPGTMADSKPRPTEKREVSAISSEIEKLASLRDRGILSESEFDTAKAKVLTANDS